MTAQPRVFIVSGPSGSGKTTVVEHLLRAVPDTMFSVSYTTRKPRAGEQDGREYSFVSREKFEEMIAREEFLEYADVFGNLYGTHAGVLAEAEKNKKDLVLDIDVQGARQVKAKLPGAVAVFLLPPSRQELERRLLARGQDSSEVIARRLEMARREIESYDNFDYLVVNHDLQETCTQVEAIVQVRREQCGASGAAIAGRANSFHAQAAAARRETTSERVSGILETFGSSSA